MRKLFLSLAAFVMALCANAQTNQYFWYQGNLMMGSPIAQIDSVTFGEEDTDSILIYLPRTITKTIEIHDTTYVTIHDTVRITESLEFPEGAIISEFSVSDTKKVCFSKGNLQYQASTDTWRFAENQYEYIGSDNANISPTYSGWIDLFGWGTGNNPTLTSTTNTDYTIFTEWGVNAITNGGNKANVWRTMTKDEWCYLFYSRSQATSLWGLGIVNGVNGTILLPDNFELPSGISFTASATLGTIDAAGNYYNSNGDNYSHNTYTLDQWTIMEGAGAVFLPAAGGRNTGKIDYAGSHGNYWSASPYVTSACYYFGCSKNRLCAQYWNDGSRHFGFSVRLVQEVDGINNPSTPEDATIVHDTIEVIVHDTLYITIHDTICPDEISTGVLTGEFSVSDTKKVCFSKGNLQYQASTDTWRFAENQYEYIGSDNANISPTYSGWIDLFGWGTGNNPTLNTNDYNDYSVFTDWGVNAITNGGDKANVWRTLTKDEWHFLFYTRSQAASLWGLGTVNGVNGTILLPDNFELPSGLSFTTSANLGSIGNMNGNYGWYTNQNEDNYSHNTYTIDQWAIMEAAGAVFFPAAGMRNPGWRSVDYAGTRGNYWSSTRRLDAERYAFMFGFRPQYLFTQNWNDSYLEFGFSVRLVQEVDE